MRLLVFLAVRSLTRRPVTLTLLVLAVAAGTGFQIPNTANLDGYSRELFRQGVARDTGDVQVAPRDAVRFEAAGELAARLRALPHVRAAVPRLVVPGVLSHGDRQQGARIVGVDPPAEDEASGLCARLTQGRCLEETRKDEVLLGALLAEHLSAGPGDRLKLAVPGEELGDVEVLSQVVTVAGVLSPGGGFSIDSDAFVPRPRLAATGGGGDVATSLAVYGKEGVSADALAAEVSPAAGEAVVRPWWDANRFVARAIEANRAIKAISTAMVVAAVAIPVLALLYVHIINERRTIALLSAQGFGRFAIFLVYLLAATLVGLIGSGLGCGLGAVVASWFTAHPIYEHAGFAVRPHLTVESFLFPCAVLSSTAVLAGILPAWLAARSDPAAVLMEP